MKTDIAIVILATGSILGTVGGWIWKKGNVAGYAEGFRSGTDYGFNDGAKAHADGECVVIDLPDGRREVCKVKN